MVVLLQGWVTEIIILMMKENNEKSTAIKVYVRVRPLVGSELGTNQVAEVQQDGKTIKISTDSVSVIETKFDQAIAKDQTQRDVYNLFRDYLPKVPEGYNLTVFAYGQTGSGKTYTMFGSDWESSYSKQQKSQQHQNTFFQDLISDENYAGLIPRTIYGLFEQIKNYQTIENQSYNIYCSFLQIFNEKIYDLLQDFAKPKPLNLHESKLDGIFVEGLAQYAVTHYLDCLELMKRGQKNRFIRHTEKNMKSSRSHTIFQILLESTKPDAKGMFRKARLNLCDLAGSQKVNKNEAMTNDHFKQLKNINQSLTTLGKVIASLSSKGKSVASFRESKLTRLLQDSLTGNTFTFIVGNISPSITNIDETMNTLKFVERARHIVMKVKPMEFNGQSMEIVNKLQKQIQYLKELLNLKRKGMSPDDVHTKLVSLQQQNQKLKKTSVSMQEVEKLIDENRKMKMEIYKLQVTQYGHTEYDNTDSKSDISLGTNIKSNSLTAAEEPKKRQPSSGFDLPHFDSERPENRHIRSPGSSGNLSEKKKPFNPGDTKKSLVSVGRSVVDPGANSIYSTPHTQKTQRNKQKQKILAKLEELERIQKFNEEKLMKDLEQLQKKNQNILNSNKNANNKGPVRKFGMAPSSTGEKKTGVNYEDRIKELEAKLFGK